MVTIASFITAMGRVYATCPGFMAGFTDSLINLYGLPRGGRVHFAVGDSKISHRDGWASPTKRFIPSCRTRFEVRNGYKKHTFVQEIYGVAGRDVGWINNGR